MHVTTCRRVYDHRMRDLVCEDRDPGLFRHLGVPRSTAVRLAPARFHAWRGIDDTCTLADRSSCPHATPGQLATEEITTVGDMVQGSSFRHM